MRQIRVVNRNGQVSIGKKFAGRTVSIEQVGDSTLTIHCGEFVPDQQKWLEPTLSAIEAGDRK